MNRQKVGREQELFLEELYIRWTTGLPPVEQRISIFSHIRDIPYAIIQGWYPADDLLRMMVTGNRGWCGPKHHLLIRMYRRLGIEIRQHTIPFRWQDQPVRYPEIIQELLPFLPDSTHLCCKAFLNGSWILLDATWDPPLRYAGFPINEPWDGLSETIPAVIATDPARKTRAMSPLPEKRKQRLDFVTELNCWMEEIRSRKEPFRQ